MQSVLGIASGSDAEARAQADYIAKPDTLINMVVPVPALAAAQVAQGIGGKVRQVGDVVGSDGMAAWGKEFAQSGADVEKQIQTENPLDEGTWANSIRNAGASMYQQLPSMVAAGPLVKAGMKGLGMATALIPMGGVTGGQSYGKYRDRGFGVAAASGGSAVDELIEVGTELLPAGRLLTYATSPAKLAVKQLASTMIKMGGEEYFGETLAALGQGITNKYLTDPNLTEEQRAQVVNDYFTKINPKTGNAEYLDDFKEAWRATTAQMVMTAGMGAGAKRLTQSRDTAGMAGPAAAEPVAVTPVADVDITPVPPTSFQNETYDDTEDMGPLTKATAPVVPATTANTADNIPSFTPATTPVTPEPAAVQGGMAPPSQAAPVVAEPVREVTEADQVDFENAVKWALNLEKQGKAYMPEIAGETEKEHAWRLLETYRKVITPTVARQGGMENGVTDTVPALQGPANVDGVPVSLLEVQKNNDGSGSNLPQSGGVTDGSLQPVSQEGSEGQTQVPDVRPEDVKPWEKAEENIKPYVESLKGMTDAQLKAEEKSTTSELNTFAANYHPIQLKGDSIQVKTGDVPYFEISGRFNAVNKEIDARKSKSKPLDANTTTLLDANAHVAATSPHNDTPEPTLAQIEAGNYKKGHVTLHGLDISVENPAGSARKGVDETGKAWETKLQHHYGYIKGTVGKDKDHVDVFIKPGIDQTTAGDKVFVIDQKNFTTGKLDEHKVMIGFNSHDEAAKAYSSNYDIGADDFSRILGVSGVSVATFKNWLEKGDHNKSFAGTPWATKREYIAPEDAATTTTPVTAKSAKKTLETMVFDHYHDKTGQFIGPDNVGNSRAALEKIKAFAEENKLPVPPMVLGGISEATRILAKQAAAPTTETVQETEPAGRSDKAKLKHLDNLQKMLRNAKTEQGKAVWRKKIAALEGKKAAAVPVEPGSLLPSGTAPEHVNVGVNDKELSEIVTEFNYAQQSMVEMEDRPFHLFDPPKKSDIVRLQDKTKVYHAEHGWMSVEDARKQIDAWRKHAQEQGKTRVNSDKIVLSLFDLSGEWSKPWVEAGYQVFRFDIQDDPEVGDVHNFSTEFFNDWFNSFDGMDIHAILAATPCTDFAVSGARHFAAKDKDGRTVSSVKLVHQTLATIEYFKPAVWALENPVGRIERLGGLPPWRLSFDPNHIGEPYTKKTLLWGRFNADLPIAPVDPVEGSKMWAQYGGKSQATKNARSVTPEGFSYAFFMANNAVDHPAMAVSGKYDRLDPGIVKAAVDAGVTPQRIDELVEDYYYQELDDDAAEQALIAETEKMGAGEKVSTEEAAKAQPAAKTASILDEINSLSLDDISAMLDQVEQDQGGTRSVGKTAKHKAFLHRMLRSAKGDKAKNKIREQLAKIRQAENRPLLELVAEKDGEIDPVGFLLRTLDTLGDVQGPRSNHARVVQVAPDEFRVTLYDKIDRDNGVENHNIESFINAVSPYGFNVDDLTDGGKNITVMTLFFAQPKTHDPKKDLVKLNDQQRYPFGKPMVTADPIVTAVIKQQSKTDAIDAVIKAGNVAAGKPEKDIGQDPFFKEGDRVQTEAGRHGTITKASSYTMRSMLIDFKSNVTTERREHSYDVRWDNGVTGYGSFNEMFPETSAAPAVVLAPFYNGAHVEPGTLLSNIDYAKKRSGQNLDAARRARKAENIAALKKAAKAEDDRAAAQQAAFDQWAEKNPEAALSFLPAKKSAPVVAAAVDSAAAPVERAAGTMPGLTVRLNSAKSGIELVFNGKPNEDILAKVKSNGFRWARGSRVWYANDTPVRRKIVEGWSGVAIGETPVVAEYQLKDNEVQPEGTPYIYRKLVDQWAYSHKPASGEPTWINMNPPLDFRDKLETLLAQKSYQVSVVEDLKAKANDYTVDYKTYMDGVFAALDNDARLLDAAAKENRDEFEKRYRKAYADVLTEELKRHRSLGRVVDGEVFVSANKNERGPLADAYRDKVRKSTEPAAAGGFTYNDIGKWVIPVKDLAVLSPGKITHVEGTGKIRIDGAGPHWNGTDYRLLTSEEQGLLKGATLSFSKPVGPAYGHYKHKAVIATNENGRLAVDGYGDSKAEAFESAVRNFKYKRPETSPVSVVAQSSTGKEIDNTPYEKEKRRKAVDAAWSMATKFINNGQGTDEYFTVFKKDLEVYVRDYYALQPDDLEAAVKNVGGYAGLYDLWSKQTARAQKATGPITKSIEAEDAAFQKEQERGADAIIKAAAAEGVKGAESALKGLHALFGGSSLKSFPGGIDEATYAAARPHFKAALDHFVSAGKGLKEYMEFLFKQFGSGIKPYAVRFFSDVKNNAPELQIDDIIKADAEKGVIVYDERGQDQEDDHGSDDGQGTQDVSGVREGWDAGEDGGGILPESDGNIRGDLLQADGRPKGSRATGKRTGSDNGQSHGMGTGNSDVAGLQGRDYRIPAGGLKREGSWKVTAERNLDIIALVKRLDAEGRPATTEEQEQLSKYTGFGASEIANKLFPGYASYGKIMENHAVAEWRPLVDKLLALDLTSEELKTLVKSSQYAHYTSEGIIRTIYDALRERGYRGGKTLDPGAGTVNFLGAMPDDLYANSKYTAIEMDFLTAKIAGYLYPQQNILQADYTKKKLPHNFFDLAIGNPPFADITILTDPEYKKNKFSLHDYFFAKTIDRVRPGGLMVFVTSRYTMDKVDDKARAYLAERADLVGAVRMPQTAFQQHSGTEVVTDILFLRKKEAETEFTGAAWNDLAEIQTAEGPAKINQYYAEHPEMILGKNSLQGTMYAANQYMVLPIEGNIDDLFATALKNLPENIYSQPVQTAATKKEQIAERDFNPSIKKEGGLYLNKDGVIMVVENGAGKQLDTGMRLSKRDREWLTDYVPLRDALKQAKYDQWHDAGWEKSLQKVNKLYQAFVKKHGLLNEFTTIDKKETDDEGNVTTNPQRRYKNTRLFRADTEGVIVEALETIDDNGVIKESAFLKTRTIRKPEPAQIKTLPDALAVSLDQTGVFDLDHIAELAKISRTEVIDGLGDMVYETTAGEWQLADEYLSGNVVRKLEEAEQAARMDDRYKRNVEALSKVQPKPLTNQDISVKLGATWLDPGIIEEFAGDVLEVPVSITYNPAIGKWRVENSAPKTRDGWYYGRRGAPKAARPQGLRGAGGEWSTSDRGPNEILEAILNNQSIKITRTDEDKKVYTDTDATAAVNEIAKNMRKRFSAWVWEDGERANILLDEYNKRYNNIAPRRFDGSHLTLPGVSLKYKLHPHQLRAIWRVIQTGDTYLAHAVGAGKTIEMIASGMEMKRLGMIAKPVYVVPNHMLEQFSSEFLDLYPMANVMVADEENFHTNNRRRFMAQAAMNNPDAIVITHSSFKLLGMKPENVTQVRDEIMSEMREHLAELQDQEGEKAPKTKQMENRIEKAEQRFDSIAVSERSDQSMTFEDLGADFMFVDEAHNYRKLDFTTSRNAKGIDPVGSKAALDMYVKSRWLQNKRPGRAIVFASGTPITNTIGELYSVQRFFQHDQMEEDGINHFDAWAAMFGEVEPGFEMNAAGRYEVVERFSKFDNMPELSKRVRSFMDVLTSDQLSAYVTIPKIKGGQPEIIIVPPSQELKEYQENTLLPRIEAAKRWKPTRDERFNPDPVIAIIADGRLASLDVRFVNNQLPSDPNSKLNRMADEIIRVYKETGKLVFTDRETGKPDAIKGGAQIVFFNNGFGESARTNRGFDARAWMMKRLKDAKIPTSEIAWIDDFGTADKKEAMMKEVRQGNKRILFGSAKQMGTGINVQKRLVALHYLDPPWYPADVIQPDGRILRQGNQNEMVTMLRYATKGSYDATQWQMVARKAKAIEQFLNGDDSVRSIEDLSESNQFAMAAALASGDERVIQLAGLQADVERLHSLQNAHAQEQSTLRWNFASSESGIKWTKNRISDLKDASKAVGGHVREFVGVLGGKRFDKREEFGQALLDRYTEIVDELLAEAPKKAGGYSREIGTINGFKIGLNYHVSKIMTEKKPSEFIENIVEKVTGQKPKKTAEFVIDGFSMDVAVTPAVGETVARSEYNSVEINESPRGLVDKFINVLNGVDKELRDRQQTLQEDQENLAVMNKRLGAPFPYANDLAEKIAEATRLQNELTAEGEQVEDHSGVGGALGQIMSVSGLDAKLNAVDVGGVESEEGPVRTSQSLKNQSIPLSDVEFDAILERITSGRGNSANGFVVVRTGNDLPAGLKKALKRQGTALDEVDGVFHRGKVYLIRDSVASEYRLEELIFHEWHGHAGLSGMFGNNGKALHDGMVDLYAAITPGRLFAIGRKYGVNLMRYGQGLHKAGYPLETRKAIMMEEMLAHLTDEYSRGGIATKIREVIGMLRDLLRKSKFFKLAELGETDIAYLLKRSRGYAESGVWNSDSDVVVVPKLMTAWHGSPHDHDGFSTAHIGTGEGAQAYGYGLYFAGAKSVAEYYRDKLGKSSNHWDIRYNGGEVPRMSAKRRAIIYIDFYDGDLSAAKEYAESVTSLDAVDLQRTLDAIDSIDPSKIEIVGKPRLYQVELAPQEDEYLLWDELLSEQPKSILDAIQNTLPAPIRRQIVMQWDFLTGKDVYQQISEYYDTDEDIRYEGNADKAASELLYSLGVRGIKYLDGTSRGKGEGNYNYVIFNDSDVSIQAKFSLRKQFEKVSETSLLDNLKGILNPLDYSRFRDTAIDHLPPVVTDWLADNLGNPFWKKENNPAAVPFYEEAKEREVARMDNNIRMFGGLVDKEGKRVGWDKVKGLLDWTDKTTAWGKIRQEQYDKLTAAQKAAYDVIRFEGDAYNKIYAQLADALRNRRIKQAGMDETTFAFYQAAIAEENKAFEVKIAIAAENMAEAGISPEEIEGHIAEFRSKYASIKGWVHRDHGEGAFQVRVYQTVDRLDFESDVVQHKGEPADRLRLGTFPGAELTKQIERIVEIKGGSFKQLRNGAIVILMPEGAGVQTLDAIDDISLTDKNGDYKYKVLTYSRFVASSAAAKKLAAQVRGDYASAMPRNHRPGYVYETFWNRSDKVQEEDYQVLKTSDMKLELILRNAIDKAKARDEVSAADATAIKDELVRSTAEILLGRGAGLYQIRRAQYLIEGYDTDNAVKKYEDYINGTAGLFSKARYALRQFNNMKNASAEIRAWATKYVSDSLRNMGTMDKWSGNVRAVVSLWYLGFNVSWMLVNSTQPYVLGQAELSRYTKGALGKIAKTEKDILTGKLSEVEKSLLEDIQVRSQDHDSVMAEMTGSLEGVTGKASQTLHNVTQMAMAIGQKVEVLNRHTMIIAGYRVFKEQGMGHATALKKALDVNSMVNIDMGRYNLPGWARGPVGRTFYALQSYIQHMLNYLWNRSSSGNRTDQKAVLRLLFAMFLIGGLPAGAPGSDELDKLILMLFGYSPKLALKEWSRKHAKEYGSAGEMLEGFVWHGIPGSLKPLGIGVSMTGSTQLRIPFLTNVIGGDDMFKALGGPAAGLATKGGRSMQAALRGDYGRAVEYLLPTAIANPLSAIRQATDGVKTAAGKRVEYKGKQLKMTPGEAVIRTIGLQPARTADISETRGFELGMQAEWNSRRKDALDNYRMSRKLKPIQEFNLALKASQARGLVPLISAESMANVWGKTNKKKNAWERAHGAD
ncbi:Helicase/UvrB, N-terminal [uncultured Caudovirales phage]|uniref:Helicase/UvrB, N-terminal n=1 Tax=uncultured Caudovirales phage TaxID=2100421 RepID=A0A6J5SE15_9CAUD|nr:Helicase/UvrB, N-terminal [uncultured Caudovirales phage]